MHMADALLAPGVAGIMYACSTAAAGHSIQKLDKDKEDQLVPVMGVMGAFVFAAQMINFTIPGTGSSGHLCGGMLLTAVVGPYAAFLTMIGVLLIQCLLFADGGLMALGANVWNMAFYGCFVGALIWRAFMRKGITRKKIIAASLLGCVLTLQLGAFSVTLETLASGITELPFTAFLAVMQPIHLAIGLVEGAVTAAVLVFLQEARPSLLWQAESADSQKQPMTLRGVLGVMAVLAAVTAGLLSLFASAFPDGLEWSLQRLTGSTELEATGSVQAFFARIQSLTALLPDYNLAGSESAAGGSAAGLIGAAVVLAAVVLLGKIIKKAAHRNGSTAPRH
ncbi:MAG: energy-coupling factor ABC transporter permease [Oscillospiraceae bacterium]|nr:energy-coupling factor ABC transporter permease [Oscillospiraceae bacterium]